MSQEIRSVYNVACQWFAVIPPLVSPATFFIDVQFGRFTPTGNSKWLVNGIKSWIFMELVSPISLTFAYFNAPLSPTHTTPPLTLKHPPTLLFTLFLVHYANRALISPLRTPSRSKAHISVPLMAIGFNVVNGTLMGSYLASPAAQHFLADAYKRPSFWAFLGLWAAGLAGNIVHDEILLNLRRNVKKRSEDGKEHYAIPYGYLYKWVSYPNYLTEWFEWLGFALAAAPFPALSWSSITTGGIAPPWLFFFSEIWFMLPRAYRGHAWYHQKFPDYPKGRKAVIPFIL